MIFSSYAKAPVPSLFLVLCQGSHNSNYSNKSLKVLLVRLMILDA